MLARTSLSSGLEVSVNVGTPNNSQHFVRRYASQYPVYLFAGWECWRMRAWRLSAPLLVQHAAGAMSILCTLDSSCLICETSMITLARPRVDFKEVRPPKVPPAGRLGRHLRGQRRPSSATGIDQGNNPSKQPYPRRQSCRYLHSRHGLWPASSRHFANVALSASSSRLAPTPPQPARCSTLRCRLATLCPRRVSGRVRLLSRTVRKPLQLHPFFR